MNRKMLTMLAVPLLAIALAASAVAFVPGILNAFSAAPTVTSIAAPAWKVGDSWTYNVSLASTSAGDVLPEEMIAQSWTTGEALVVGTVKKTVVGNVSTDYGPAWNMTVESSLRVNEPQSTNETQSMLTTYAMPAAEVTGFVWYRQSDLAPVYALKSVHLSSTWTSSWGNWSGWGMLANGTYSVTYSSTIQLWYHPPLAIWQFPLEANESWNVTSNATIRHDSSFDFEGPNFTYSSNHSATFTVPLELGIRTGTFEDVTTPAGTFRALSVSVAHREPFEVPDRDTGAIMNLTGGSDVDTAPPFATAWFSGQVGNVVKASVGGAWGPRVELDLVSYTYS